MKHILMLLALFGCVACAQAQGERITYTGPVTCTIVSGETISDLVPIGIRGILTGISVTPPDLTGSHTITLTIEDTLGADWWLKASIVEGATTILMPADSSAPNWAVGDLVPVMHDWTVKITSSDVEGAEREIDVRFAVLAE